MAKRSISRIKDIISRGQCHDNDVAILAAAKQINVDYLITLDIRDFIEDKNVAEKSGLKIITPENFLRAALTA